MFKKCLLVARDIDEVKFLLKFLEKMKFEGMITLATLDVTYIPVSKTVVCLKHSEWINECLRSFQEYTQRMKIKMVEYDGSGTPADALINLVREEECDLVLVVRRSLNKGIGTDLALSLAGLSPVTVMVIPYGSV